MPPRTYVVNVTCDIGMGIHLAVQPKPPTIHCIILAAMAVLPRIL